MTEFEHHFTAIMENKLCPTEARFFRLGKICTRTL